MTMCKCSGVVYMENANCCHECGGKIRVCKDCKADLRDNKGKFCHMCGGKFQEIKKKEPLYCKCISCQNDLQNNSKNDSKFQDSQFLALASLIGNQDEIFKTLMELLFKEVFYFMPRCEQDLKDIWHLHQVVSTKELIENQSSIVRSQKCAKADLVREFFFALIYFFRKQSRNRFTS